MASNFPSSLDSFTNPSSSDALDSVSVPHATQHSDLNDAVEAIETALLDGAPLHIDDANERVGVGNVSPSYKLDVTGDINATSDIKLAGDSMPRGVVGSDVVTSTVPLTTSNQTTHTVTFTAVTGRKYVATFCGLFEGNNTSGANYLIDIKQDGTRLMAGRYECTTTNIDVSKTVMVELPSTSGSTTVIVEIGLTAGTGQLAASATNRSTFVVLDTGT